MADLNALAKNALLSSTALRSGTGNEPGRYADRQKQYFVPESDRFRLLNLRYSSDFVAARAQGLFRDEPEGWTDCKIRMAEVVRPSAAIQRDFDDYKQILMEEPKLSYIPEGTKFDAMGSIWLMVNPMNVSSGDGSGIVRRCRATWRHLDYYGNILDEPLVVESMRANASDPDSQQWENITKGYFNIICQKNRWTSQLVENSRLILGKGAYNVTGLSDFLEEFTGDPDSARLIRFTARYEEPNAKIDDMENRVAGGKSFSWSIRITGTPTLTAGMGGSVTAASIRNGTPAEDSTENPITYLWDSTDESICTVDDEGNLMGIAPGNAAIVCTLLENPAIKAEYAVTVESAAAGGRVAFTSAIPEKLEMYQSFTAEAALYENGIKTDRKVEFSFSGAAKGTYSGEISGNRVTVTCWGGSPENLRITAACEGKSESVEVKLAGI